MRSSWNFFTKTAKAATEIVSTAAEKGKKGAGKAVAETVKKVADVAGEGRLHQVTFREEVSKAAGMEMKAEFMQTFFGNYLPGEEGNLGKGSKGACAFTTIDFFRAATQNCLEEWLALERTAAGASNFTQRLQYFQDNSSYYLLDYLFRRTILPEEKADTDDDFLRDDRPINFGGLLETGLYAEDAKNKPENNLELFACDSIHEAVNGVGEIYKKFSEKFISEYVSTGDEAIDNAIWLSSSPCLEMTFHFHSARHAIDVSHSVAFYLKDANTLYYTDANVGVVEMHLDEPGVLAKFSDLFQNTLHEGLTLNSFHVRQVIPYWIHDISLVSDELKVKESTYVFDDRYFKRNQACFLETTSPANVEEGGFIVLSEPNTSKKKELDDAKNDDGFYELEKITPPDYYIYNPLDGTVAEVKSPSPSPDVPGMGAV